MLVMRFAGSCCLDAALRGHFPALCQTCVRVSVTVSNLFVLSFAQDLDGIEFFCGQAEASKAMRDDDLNIASARLSFNSCIWLLI